LDEGVPRAVGRVLESLEHEVIYLHQAIAPGSSDLIVCAAAEANESILVALDGDMREIAKGHGVSGSRYKKLSLIKLSCNETNAASRVRQFIELIEAEWRISDAKASRRLFIDISEGRITIYR
jgi:predicted nuclease of predicted toxin-antitoxin system